MKSLPLVTTKKKGTQKISLNNKGSLKSNTTLVKVSQQKSSKESRKRIPSLYLKKVKRYTKQGVRAVLLSPVFHTSFKIIAGGLIFGSAIYGSYSFIGKTFANEVVVSQSEIIARVALLTPLPKESPYDVVRVQDEDILKKQNPFYKDVKEGDYILMYKDVAVVYDLRNNSIVSLKRTENH